MNDYRGTVSNLMLNSNLLKGDDYQQQFPRLSFFELMVIHRRKPLLGISFDPSHLTCVTSEQSMAHREYLFWRNSVPCLHTERRVCNCMEQIAKTMFPYFDSNEDQLGEEEAFEILYVCAELQRQKSGLVAKAVDIRRRIIRLLQSPRYKYTQEHIEMRLGQIIGNNYVRPE